MEPDFESMTMPDGADWEHVAAALGDVIAYEREDDYQGQWCATVRTLDGRVAFLAGYFGSCSGCDPIQAIEPWSDEHDAEWRRIVQGAWNEARFGQDGADHFERIAGESWSEDFRDKLVKVAAAAGYTITPHGADDS